MIDGWVSGGGTDTSLCVAVHPERARGPGEDGAVDEAERRLPSGAERWVIVSTQI